MNKRKEIIVANTVYTSLCIRDVSLFSSVSKIYLMVSSWCTLQFFVDISNTVVNILCVEFFFFFFCISDYFLELVPELPIAESKQIALLKLLITFCPVADQKVCIRGMRVLVYAFSNPYLFILFIFTILITPKWYLFVLIWLTIRAYFTCTSILQLKKHHCHIIYERHTHTLWIFNRKLQINYDTSKH